MKYIFILIIMASCQKEQLNSMAVSRPDDPQDTWSLYTQDYDANYSRIHVTEYGLMQNSDIIKKGDTRIDMVKKGIQYNVRLTTNLPSYMVIKRNDTIIYSGKTTQWSH